MNATIAHETDRFVNDVTDELLKPLERAVRNFGRASRGGLIQLNVRMTRSPRRVRPRPAMTSHPDLLRNVSCHICGRPYGVFALALFCPDCGGPNLSTHLARERALVEADLNNAERLEKSGEQEHSHRRRADAHENVVSVTEKFLKAVFELVVRRRLATPEAEAAIAKVGNAFQNVSRGREHFANLDLDPYSSLSATDLDFVQAMMLRRHVVTHNLGLADAKFVKQTGAVGVGRNLAVSEHEILRYLDILRTVVEWCESSVPELRGPVRDPSD